MYTEFLPHIALRPYIDAYWTVRTDKIEPQIARILPDRCIDIIINLGSPFKTDDTTTFKSGGVYIVGTMTTYIEGVRENNTHLIGIRFKPLGFTTFFRFPSLHEVTDKSVEFEYAMPDVELLNEMGIATLDRFFLNRQQAQNTMLAQVVKTIDHSNGRLSVSKLAEEYRVTRRHLERHFMRQLGITPKEYINLTRFTYTVKQITSFRGKRSLQEIAFDTGYYDHAHMANEIKKYSGLLPSQL